MSHRAPPEPRALDYLVALLLLLASVSALGLAQRTQGIVRDEATYFDAARSYWGWFAELGDNLEKGGHRTALTRRSIDRHWGANHEHPVLLKSLFAFSWRLLAGPADSPKASPSAFPWLSESGAFRLPGWLLTGLALALIYLFGVHIDSRMAGLTAALAYITLPRLFFHGQLACFDSGIATMSLLVVYAYLRGLSEARWALLAGVAFGLALATKHNAWFLPPLLLIHYVVVVWPDCSLRPLSLPRIPLVFVSMALIGPLLFWAHWPWLWVDTFARVQEYLAFHLHHTYYDIAFLGQNYNTPPFPISYPFVMTLFTVPTVVLLLALAGILVYLRAPMVGILGRWVGDQPARFNDAFRFPARRTWLRPAEGLNPRIGTLLALNAIFPLALIALPSTPIFGATKHWLTAYPFFALLAGVALSRLCGRIAQGRILRAACLLLPLLVAVPGALSIWTTHPFGLSQYNAMAGGVAGGADLGLDRQFWGYAPRQLLPWLDEDAPKGAAVYFHDINHASYRQYQREGLLRRDLRWSGMEEPGIRSSRYAMVVHAMHFNKYDYWIWEAYGTCTPAKVLTLQGVPLVTVYKRPEPR